MESVLDMVLMPKQGLIANAKCKAWLAVDGRTVCIDEDYFNTDLPEVRETIMHEVAHAQLHQRLLPHSAVTRLGDYDSFRARLSQEEVEFAELEARAFCGHVLVPTRLLEMSFSLANARRLLRARQPPHSQRDPELELAAIARQIAVRYGVTDALAMRRISEERLLEKSPYLFLQLDQSSAASLLA